VGRGRGLGCLVRAGRTGWGGGEPALEVHGLSEGHERDQAIPTSTPASRRSLPYAAYKPEEPPTHGSSSLQPSKPRERLARARPRLPWPAGLPSSTPALPEGWWDPPWPSLRINHPQQQPSQPACPRGGGAFRSTAILGGSETLAFIVRGGLEGGGGVRRGLPLEPVSHRNGLCDLLRGRRPRSAPSALLGPLEEGGDVPHRHVAGQRFDSQVPVVRQQNHFPEQTDGIVCNESESGMKLRPPRSAPALAPVPQPAGPTPCPATLPGRCVPRHGRAARHPGSAPSSPLPAKASWHGSEATLHLQGCLLPSLCWLGDDL